MKQHSSADTGLHTVLGARLINNEKVGFCVWAPDHDQVVVHLVEQDRQVELLRNPEGFHVRDIDDVSAGARYMYKIGGSLRPDPASRFQPDGVHGASQVVDHNFDWTDSHWQGVPKEDLVIYELHIGSFTETGTFLAAIERLDELVDLGVTAIELMPVATAAGKWNWGYDGVNLFAPSPNYGTPHELRHLINAAHNKGLAVILDVVYNHLGPEGNYLAEFGPYFSKRHTTPWGAAPNFDDDGCQQLRRFFVANAIAWFDEYHFDGLRVDAIHCMRDDSEPHIAAEISEAVEQWSNKSGRRAMLIAESNVYDPNMLAPRCSGGIGFDAEWCDDFLHGVFAVVRPGEQLCHRSYQTDDLQQTLKYGYVYEGTLREQRGRRKPTERIDTQGLIYSIQHHDFIGNHPLGKRLHQLTCTDTQRAAAALLLLSPAIPMLFMGEEFACEHPFRFFVDFGDERLRQAVVDGRKAEYPQHDWASGRLPTDPETFTESKIGPASDGDQAMRTWYRKLLAVRKNWRAIGLLTDGNLAIETDLSAGLYLLKYSDGGSQATVAVRLATQDAAESPLTIEADGDLLVDSRSNHDPNVILPNHAQIFLRKH